MGSEDMDLIKVRKKGLLWLQIILPVMYSLPDLCTGSSSTVQSDAVIGVAGENKKSDGKERNKTTRQKDNENNERKGKAESK